MKERLIPLVIKFGADILAIMLVYSFLHNQINMILQYFNIVDPKAITLSFAAFFVLIMSIIYIILDWFFTKVLFAKVEIKIGFFNVLTDKAIEKVTVKNVDPAASEGSYKINVLISGGNRLTNSILNKLGSDLTIKYRPDVYDTEISSGWASSSKSNLYKDKAGNIRYYWSDAIHGQNKIIEGSIILRPSVIIKPKRFDVPKCKVVIGLSSSQKRNFINRPLFFIFRYLLIHLQHEVFNIELK